MDNNDDNVIHLPAKCGKRRPVKGQRLTEKQEKFAQLLASNVHFNDAFHQVYNCENMQDDTSYKRASKESRNPKVLKRVEELRELARAANFENGGVLQEAVKEIIKYQAAEVVDVVINQRVMVQELMTDSKLARQMGQISASVAAWKEIGKVTGLTSDGRDARQLSDIDRMDVAQLKEFISEKLQDLRLIDDDLTIIDMTPPKNTLN